MGNKKFKINDEKLKKIELLVNEIMLRLSDLNPYVFHGPSQWGSYYIKFKDNDSLRSIRVADHKSKFEKYRYKWNLELGGKTRDEIDETGKDFKVTRFYYSHTDIARMCDRITCYNNKIVQRKTAQ
jgi:hypothetical protein